MKKIKDKIIEILREYSCWTPKDHYSCIPKLADQILKETKREIIGETDGLKKDGSEINYEEDNYASGYNKALEDILKAIKL